MAQFPINIPNAKVQDVVDAWGEGYSETLLNGQQNPQTKLQFAKENIRHVLSDKVLVYLKKLQTPPDDPGITIG